MKKINSIKKLDEIVRNGAPLFWYSHIFQIAFEIDYIDRTTYSFNHIECRFKHSKNKSTISLKDIYTN
jgi:hypothetical protein